ncbi:MAG: hypothetical protein U0Y82_08415 [Thermoleophilia bacterium]
MTLRPGGEDLIIVLGGDKFGAARPRPRGLPGAPVIGVNFGRVASLCAIERAMT